MQFISVRDFRTSSADIWKRLPEEREMVITNNGRPIAILTPTSDKDFEDNLSAIRQGKAIQAVRSMQETSVRLGNDKMTLDEINAIIDDTRKRRKNADSN